MYIESQYDLAQINSNPSACFLRHEQYKAPEEWTNVSHSIAMYSEDKDVVLSW